MYDFKKRIHKTPGFLFFLFFLVPSLSMAQIIPPGMGKTHVNSWFALGMNQDLEKMKNEGWRSSTYLGIGRISNQDSHRPFKDPGIFILNQEFYNQFATHWEYSLAVSFRNQKLYEKEAPYAPADPDHKNEFRLYSRFSYLWKTDFMDITPTLRQEISKYVTPDFHAHSEDWRLRTRFRMKFSLPLNPGKTQRLLLYSEQLFSTSRQLESKKWDKFSYSDSRFSLYYSVKPSAIPVTFNLGYMLNWIGEGADYTGHYLALDLIWRNPFSAEE